MKDLEIKKALLSCPGDTIQEHIDFIGMSQAELAERMGRSVPKLNELIKGKATLSPETAIRLEYVLGVPAGFWLNLERLYQDQLLEIQQLESLRQGQQWVKGFPLRTLWQMNVIPNTRKAHEQSAALLKFFRVASPAEWSAIYEGNSQNFKFELKHFTDPKAISAWLRLGELQAEKLDVAPFDKKKLSDNIPLMQAIMHSQPDNWLQELQQLSRHCGIALAFTPCISKAPVYGASRWIKNKTMPLVQLTNRQKDYSAFWFTFFHELAHIRYHNKSDIFIDGLEVISPDKSKEAEADAFAVRMLLSEKERNEIFKYNGFDKELIIQLSRRLKKHPGIIVAQIQRKYNHLNKDNQLNSLKPTVIFEQV